MNAGGWFIGSSIRKQRSYTACLAACLMVMYSASVVEVETVHCFFEHHDITPLTRKKQYLIVDFLSLMSLAKLLSA